MRTRAAVMRATGKPLEIEEIELDPPREGEVLLRMAAAGICGSDLHILKGELPSPVPAVAGHEGSGVVEAVGPGVTRVKPGDHVIQTFIAMCGQCEACLRGQLSFCANAMPQGGTFADGTHRMHSLSGEPIGTTLRLGSFAEHTVTTENNCTVIPKDIDLVSAALVSCGVSTGVGAAINVAKVSPGDTVAVVGIGGVGAAALVGAVLAGASQVIAVDIAESKRAIALELGATEYVDAGSTNLLDAVMAATGGRGVDKVLLTMDVIRGPQVAAAVNSLAPEGIAVVVGVSEAGLDSIPIAPSALLGRQRSLTGTVYGSINPRRDALRWLDLYRTGRLPLERFITQRYPLERINDAFDDLVAGKNLRGVVVYGTE
jgi:NDMA-dependent alcohol dehydrogenase